jgi:CspA family cold shock protein
MEAGKVKWFNPVKGYGFIKNDEKEEEALIHASLLKQRGIENITPGQKILYEAVSNNGRLRVVKFIFPEE